MRKNRLAALVAAIVTSAVFSQPASAVSSSSDYSALWWNAAESGWGMNVIQQEQILFITMFVYGPNSTPTWYVASNVSFVSVNSSGDRTYTGALYATTGTPFSIVPFNSNAVTVQQVGNISFIGKADGTATAQYTVGTSTVSKTITRQTWAKPSSPQNGALTYVVASYNVGSTGSGAACSSSPVPYNSYVPNVSISLNSTAKTMRTDFVTNPGDGGTCSLSGTNYEQEGQYGRVTLIGRCSELPAGAQDIRQELREVEIGPNFFVAQFTRTGGFEPNCTIRGVMVGAQR